MQQRIHRGKTSFQLLRNDDMQENGFAGLVMRSGAPRDGGMDG
jgi:hypothetical protein